MPPFEHLHLFQHKGLKDAKLENLGKINVLCGPNNSGKTTTLECVINESSRDMGIRINGTNILDEIRQESDSVLKLAHKSYVQSYEEIVNNTILSEKILFEREVGDAINKVFETWKSKHPGHALPNNTLPHLSNVLYNQFKPKPTVTLIPAKRRLEIEKQLNSSNNIQPDGSGILDFVFSAFTHDPSSTSFRQLDLMRRAFIEISGGCNFSVQIAANNLIRLFFENKDNFRHKADDCGIGLRDLIIILFFAYSPDCDIVLIEEPENHLHPEMQRRLISWIKKNTEKQFFLSTHSSVFLNTQFADRVFTCKMTDSVQIENATSRANALTEMGYSIADNLISDVVVLCEGPSDKAVLDEFFQKMGLLNRFSIKVWPLGGDIMDQLDLSAFSENHSLTAIIDNDPGSNRVREKFIKNCKERNIPVHRLEKYSIENYFSVNAVRAIMKGQMPESITEFASDKKMLDQLGFDVKRNNGRIAREMTLQEIEGTDFHNFLKQVEQVALAHQGK